MNNNNFFENFFTRFEHTITIALAVSIMIAIAYATILFFVILLMTILNVDELWAAIMEIRHAEGTVIQEPLARLQAGLYHVFGGFLLILLGIELINTIKTFAIENHIKIKSIVAIAIIASARHLITLDYHHTEALVVFAAGFVVIALIVGYYLLTKTNS